ncbi:uncharacterized protein LOC111268944 isoform X2 [Varroa jacobsoni]|uniref:uncharacterized protein LOC111268944 isoform X2 n=1 Tax=Varroa jacobsoni TaxID=62625 RepID=UPI000BF6BA19|nr:uncharacterized protein LOC111268944 isoform X2 [Varroa jacobsoni]
MLMPLPAVKAVPIDYAIHLLASYRLPWIHLRITLSLNKSTMATYFQCYDAADESSSCCVLSSHRSYSIDRLVIKAQKELKAGYVHHTRIMNLQRPAYRRLSTSCPCRLHLRGTILLSS